MDTKVLFKNRSITSCMKAAYDYTGSHFTSLIKKTWWATLIYAILMAITVYFRMPNKGLHDWGVENPITSYLLQTIIYAMTWFSFCLSSAAILDMVCQDIIRKNLLKFTIVYIIFEIIGGFAIGFGYGGTSAIYQAMATKAMAANSTLTLTYAVTGIVAIILLVIVALLALPFAHIIPPCYAQAKRRKAETLEHLQRGSQTPGQHFPDEFLGNDHYLHHFLYRTDTNLHHELGTDVISNGSLRWRPAWSPCLFHSITFDCLEYHDICPDIRCKLVRHFLCLSLWFKYQSGEKEKRTAKYK